MRKIILESLIFVLLMTGFMVYLACDSSTVARGGNHPPVIDQILANPDTMLINALCSLEVVASDADGDSLRYQWSANAGTFISGAQDTAATWQAPALPGSYTITVAVSDDDSTVSADKDVTVTSTTMLSVSTDTLTFGPGVDTQVFTIENTGTGDLTYDLVNMADWLTLSKDNGTLTAERRAGKTAELAVSSEDITVTVNRTGLSEGTYMDLITVISNGGTAQIGVGMVVPAGPVLDVSETSLDFGTTETQLTFDVMNAGQGTLNWQAGTTDAWITGVAPDNGDCDAGESDQVSVTVDRAGLDAGTYSGMVVVNSDAGIDTVLVQMDVVIVSNPVLTVRPENLSFGNNGTEDTLRITNTGDGTLNWNIGTTESWLTCNPTSGSVTTETADVIVTVDRTGLPEGDYNGTIPVTSNDGSVDVNVDMTVSMNPLEEDFSGDLSEWSTTYANAWIDNGEAHVACTLLDRDGILHYDFAEPVSAEYIIKIKMARAGSGTVDNYYGLWFAVNDTGDITITYFAFLIHPFYYVTNYEIMAYIGPGAPVPEGWYLIDPQSTGFYSHINMGLNEWNELSWQVKEDGRTNLRLAGVLFYNNDLVARFKSYLGIYLETDLVSVGLVTNPLLEAKMDEITVETPGAAAGSISRRGGPWLTPANSSSRPLPPLPKDMSQVKTLSDMVPKKNFK